ncbi:MAG TPA: hypothetical protein VGD50_04690, partial [Candidatus Baltobacteraceae bacterium]
MSDVVELRPRLGAVGLRAISLTIWLYAIFAAVTLGLHVATAGQYGYQRDEFYFLECAKHLAWGYVDQPPLVPAVAWLVN